MAVSLHNPSSLPRNHPQRCWCRRQGSALRSLAPLFATTDEDRVYLGLVARRSSPTYIEGSEVLEEVGTAYLSLPPKRRLGTTHHELP